MNNIEMPNFDEIFNQVPRARAKINGSILYPNIKGDVWFYQALYGVFVVAYIEGLPNTKGVCRGDVFGFHIHEGRSCTGKDMDFFADTGSHYNPNNCKHPQHAGDLPPLFGANGYAFLAVLSDRFTINEILGKTIVIHSEADDFVSQPAGNSGIKIACGEIKIFK